MENLLPQYSQFKNFFAYRIEILSNVLLVCVALDCIELEICCHNFHNSNKLLCISCQCFFRVYIIRKQNLTNQTNFKIKLLINFQQKYFIYLIAQLLHISMDYILIISASTHLRIIIRIIFPNFLYTPGPFEEDKLGKSWWLAQIQSLLAVHSRSGCVQELNNQTEIELCIYNARTVLLFSLEKIPISTCIQQYISPTCRK